MLTQPYVGEFEAGHYMYQWADRPPERVTVMRVRARITDPAGGATILAGTYTSLRARATDAAGNVQPEVPPWNRLGHGNNAIEVSYVDVR